MKSVLLKKINVLDSLRELSAIVLIIWSLNPMLSFYSRYIDGALLLIWLMLAFISDPSKFIKTLQNKGFLFSFAFPIFEGIRSILLQYEINTTNFLYPFIFFMFWYYYNQNNSKAMRLLFLVGLIYYLSISIYSINALSLDSRIARYLAQGDQSLTIRYAHPLMANFNFTYSATLIALLLVGFLSVDRHYKMNFIVKICVIVAYVILLTVIILAQYTIAILLLLFFTLIIYIINRPKNKFNIIILLMMLMIGALVFINIENLFYFLANLTSSPTIKVRLNEVGNILSGQKISSNYNLSLRLKLYNDSIQTFLSNPIFGIGKETYRMGGLVGGHSELFDSLAYFGLSGAFFMFTGLFLNFKYISLKLPKPIKNIYTYIFVLFVAHSFLNLTYSSPILFILYLIIPFGLCAFYQQFINKELEL